MALPGHHPSSPRGKAAGIGSRPKIPVLENIEENWVWFCHFLGVARFRIDRIPAFAGMTARGWGRSRGCAGQARA